ncbi:MAG: ATP-dependent metalloprotease FtsH [Verrucomicrobiales bacterium]|nr:ATP-dependent metalloprotease FtsH [Verrucomicrobiales bacterium]
MAGGAALLIAAFAIFYSTRVGQSEVTRTQLQSWIKQDAIIKAEVTPTVYPGIYQVSGERKEGAKTTAFSLSTHLEEAEIKALYENKSVEILIPGQGMKADMIKVVPIILTGALLVFLLYYQLNMGKGKSHMIRERPTTRFSDVAGVDEAKAEVAEVVDFLKNPAKYKTFGGKLPKGILLIGPPGTGKTLLAKAIAGEAQANFFSAHGSDFNEVFVGVGAKRIRELFKQARKNAPAIIFIDEVDCLGKKRRADSNSELQQTNNALLAAMDGFENSEGIVVVAATNRPEDLDDALMRPGRFDRKVQVLLPDMKGRAEILAVQAKNKPISNKEKSLAVLAQSTSELSGADLAAILNEAAIMSAQKNHTEIHMAELEEARDKVRWGKERKSMVLRKAEREMVAYHEAGHTIVNLNKTLLPPLYKVSIIPRGQALGTTTMLPTEDHNIYMKTFILEQLSVLMGGRAAERVFYGATTNGAHGDLNSAKDLAKNMIHHWGMGDKLYYQVDHSDAEEEINRLLEQADKEAYDLVLKEKENTHKLAQALLKHETLTREEVLALLHENKHPQPRITVDCVLN